MQERIELDGKCRALLESIRDNCDRLLKREWADGRVYKYDWQTTENLGFELNLIDNDILHLIEYR